MAPQQRGLLFDGEEHKAEEPWRREWRGMPEFVQEDATSVDSFPVSFGDRTDGSGIIQVHFETKEDGVEFRRRLTEAVGPRGLNAPPSKLGREWFSGLVEQPISPNTRSIWFPQAEVGHVSHMRWSSADPLNPRYPVYVISKGRWESRLTSKSLEELGVPYHIVVEPQEADRYREVISADKVLELPFSNLGLGSIPARNWVWEHALTTGAARHWVLDDNLMGFYRLNRNFKTEVSDGTIFRCAEDLVDRYENVAIAGFHYYMFASRKNKMAPFTLNSRVYSCILLRNDLPYRWRGRYNEDTDLSVRALKDGHCTVLFLAFLCWKMTTLTMKGGNTDELYAGAGAAYAEWEAHAKDCGECQQMRFCARAREVLSADGRWKMADALQQQHPDVTEVTRKWNRWQHHVDYSRFRDNILRPRQDLVMPEGSNDYGMALKQIAAAPDKFSRAKAPETRAQERAKRGAPSSKTQVEVVPAARHAVLPMPEGWTPDPYPDLRGVTEFACDLETTGLKWYAGDRPCGVSVGWRDPETGALRSAYLPTRHEGGGNLPEEQVQAWLRDALLDGRQVSNLNTKFDAHHSEEWGVSWRGARLHDIAHAAALLDDHRGRGWSRADTPFSLNAVAEDYCGRRKEDLDMSRGAHVWPAWQAASYARTDVELVVECRDKMRPLLTAEGLDEVVALEDSVIPCVVEMERNAALIDVAKLRLWVAESERDMERLSLQLDMAAGFHVNPDSHEDLARLFRDRGLESAYRTLKKGEESFNAEALAEAAERDPVIRDALGVAQLKDLRSRYIIPYDEAVGDDGLLRFEFHQLKGDQYGTVSGRFSATKPIGSSKGANPQQVIAVGKHRRQHGDRYCIRELYVSRTGIVAAPDAKQIEYRVFADLSRSERLRAAYARDPNTDFHEWTGDAVRRLRPDFDRKRLKIINFMSLFGGGTAKMTEKMGITSAEGKELMGVYHRTVPEARTTINRASDRAKSVGYIRTLLGRRARYPPCPDHGTRGWIKQRPCASCAKYYTALNRAVSGGAADLNKRKLRETYDVREELGITLRMTVHDEFVADVPDLDSARRWLEVLDRQTTPLRVPILWSMETGPTWAHCDKDYFKGGR